MTRDRQSAWAAYLEEVERLRGLPPGPADTVRNGSFEEGDGSEPDGWHLAAGTSGDSAEWLASGGSDGGRCLRLSPRGGGGSWHSGPIPVSGGAEYLFRCRMKREGDGHWAHACRASDVVLAFFDGEGRPARAGSETVFVRACGTSGWVEGWRHLEAPTDAATLRIAFRLIRGETPADLPGDVRESLYGGVDTGQWWIDEVRLDRVPLPVEAAKGVLRIRIPGGDARVRIANPHGEDFAPPDSHCYAAAGAFHPLRDEVCIALPAGSYTVEAMRGFQREPFSKSVEIVEGHETRVTAELPRVVDWPAHGWYTGDHHAHLADRPGTRHPLLTADDVCRIARGEGLDYLSLCGELSEQHDHVAWREAGRPLASRPEGACQFDGFIGTLSYEVANDALGHLCIVNAQGRVEPGLPGATVPTNAEIALAVRRATRGALAMSHPWAGLSREDVLRTLANPARGRFHRERPVDVALGFADTFDILSSDPPEDMDLLFEDYYRLLNLGLRIGVSGSSGAVADRGSELVGSVVTFARAGRLHMDAIAAAYEAHRTMASNGPLIRLSVNGEQAGGTVRGTKLTVEGEAYSNWGLTRLEIVASGVSVADATPDEEGWARLRTDWSPDSSGWIIARAWGPGHPALNTRCVPASRREERGQWAITSPVYVEVPGRPIVPRREDAEYYLRWIDACIEALRGREDSARAVALFRQGRAYFTDLISGY